MDANCIYTFQGYTLAGIYYNAQTQQVTKARLCQRDGKRSYLHPQRGNGRIFSNIQCTCPRV